MEINYQIEVREAEEERSIPMSFEFHEHNILECGSDDEAVEAIASLINDHFRMNTTRSYDMKYFREEVRRLRGLHGMPE